MGEGHLKLSKTSRLQNIVKSVQDMNNQQFLILEKQLTEQFSNLQYSYNCSVESYTRDVEEAKAQINILQSELATRNAVIKELQGVLNMYESGFNEKRDEEEVSKCRGDILLKMEQFAMTLSNNQRQIKKTVLLHSKLSKEKEKVKYNQFKSESTEKTG